MTNQKFRFCCSCQRVSLIKVDGCFVCGSNFIIDGLKTEAYLEDIKQFNNSKKDKISI